MFHRFYIDTNYKYTVSYMVKGRNLLAQFYNGLQKRQFLKNLKSIHIPGKIRLPLRKIWTKFYIKYGYDHITSIIKVIIICRVVYVTLPKQNQPIIRKNKFDWTPDDIRTEKISNFWNSIWVFFLIQFNAIQLKQAEGKLINQSWENGEKSNFGPDFRPLTQIWPPIFFFVDFICSRY